MTGPEAKIETYLTEQVTAAGGICMKMSRVKDAPDRVVVMNGITAFVELKAPGEKPRDSQVRMFHKMAGCGGLIFIIDDKEQVDKFMGFLMLDYEDEFDDFPVMGKDLH